LGGIPDVEVVARYEPAVERTEVGGDWYDAMPVRGGRLFVVVGDVSGHGIKAAATMASLRFAARAYAAEGCDPATLLTKLGMLLDVGYDAEFATVLWMEGLFRNFTNRRQLAAYAGLAPSPWKSGCVDREQGIAKSGNPRLRTTMVELAWLWLRYQPDSALSRWFRERVGSERGRIRRIAIVALARKLLVALWRYTTLGDLPVGAALKTT